MGGKYVLDRDARGLTALQRQVLDLVGTGAQPVEIRERLGGMTKQRVHAILRVLERKGFVTQAWVWIPVTPPDDDGPTTT